MRRYDGRTQVGSVLKDSHIKPSPAIGSIVSIRPSHPTSALARPDAPTWTGQRTWWSPWCIPGYNLSNIYIYIIKLYWCCSAGPLFCLFVVVVVVVGCCVGACFFFGCCVLFWFLLVLRWMKSILGLRLSIWSAQVHLGINPAGAGGYDVSKHPHTG